MIRRFVACSAAIAALSIYGAPGAFAASYNGPLVTTDGSSAKFYFDGDYFRVCDTDPDGDAVYVKFHYAGSGGDLKRFNRGGSGTCLNITKNINEGTTVYYQSCQDDLPPDTCSSEVYGKA